MTKIWEVDYNYINDSKTVAIIQRALIDTGFRLFSYRDDWIAVGTDHLVTLFRLKYPNIKCEIFESIFTSVPTHFIFELKVRN